MMPLLHRYKRFTLKVSTTVHNVLERSRLSACVTVIITVVVLPCFPEVKIIEPRE